MKYVDDIVKEINKKGSIDTNGYMYDKDDEWENYMRGIKPKRRKEKNEDKDRDSRWYLLWFTGGISFGR